MPSSPECCCVCPVHGRPVCSPAAGAADPGPGWAEPARECLDSVVGWLDGSQAMAAGHGELEARLQVHSREQYRLLFLGHLDERARRETRRSGVTGSDGVPRPRAENGHSRGLTSVFGSVRVTRKAYRAVPGTSAEPATAASTPWATEPVSVTAGCVAAAGSTTAGNLHPADAVLNLPLVRHSAGLARLAAIEAARGSYDDAREAIERASGVVLRKRQVEGLARHAAVDVNPFYAARQPEPCPGLVLGLQCDGKGVVMCPGHLRPGTAKAAAKASTKLSTRLSLGEKHGRKRLAEIVAVYDLDPEPRTVEDIIPAGGTSRAGKPVRHPGPVVTGKWLAANLTDDIPAVITAMFDEADRRDPDHRRTWVALVDGNRQQIDAITAQAATRNVTVTSG
jgi:hypothetical protein